MLRSTHKIVLRILEQKVNAHTLSKETKLILHRAAPLATWSKNAKRCTGAGFYPRPPASKSPDRRSQLCNVVFHQLRKHPKRGLSSGSGIGSSLFPAPTCQQPDLPQVVPNLWARVQLIHHLLMCGHTKALLLKPSKTVSDSLQEK